MSKEGPWEDPGSSGWRVGGPAVRAPCPVWNGQEVDGEHDGGDDRPPSALQASPSCLVNLEAWQLLLYFPTGHQLLSRGPKIAVHRKALRGKQPGWRGLAQPQPGAVGGSGDVYSPGQGRHGTAPASSGPGRGKELQ